MTFSSYTVSASHVPSQPSAQMIASVPVGCVSTVGVLPEVKTTSQMPVADGVKSSVATSPQTYRIPAFAVIVGVVPLTETGAESISWIADFAASVYVPTALLDCDWVVSPAAFALP